MKTRSNLTANAHESSASSTQAVELESTALSTAGGFQLRPEDHPRLETEVVEGIFPLSSTQESLWLIEQMWPGRAAYNMPEAWRFTGDLNIPVLEKALYALVQRHEPLRTVIRAVAGRPEQAILTAKPLKLPVHNLTYAPDANAELTLRMREEAGRPFNLKGGPLFRATLFRLGSREHVLFVNIHHIVSDGWSQNVFAEDLGNLYRAAIDPNEPALPQLPIQYADYAVWQREEMRSRNIERAVDYWKRQLAAPLPELELPTDKTRSAAPTGEGKTDFATLSTDLTGALKALSQEQGVTLSTTLIAGFAAWLHRATGSPEVLFGSPFAGREPLETERLIGFFVNTHALRIDLSGDPTVKELLRRVRSVLFEAAENQQAPSNAILQAVKPERKGSGQHPLFQVVFGFQGSVVDDLSLPGVEARRIEVANDSAKFDWAVLLTPSEGTLRVRSEYSTDLFEPGTTAAFVRQWQQLLHSMAATPEMPVSRLPLMTAQERFQIVPQGQAESVYERDATVYELFEQQAAAQPEKIALLTPTRGHGAESGWQFKTLTYGELNRQANRVARRLQECGAGPGTRVAVSMDRSIELVTVLLGILKTGATYVPIDKQSPAERVEFMCRDCMAPILVTEHREEGRMYAGTAVFALDAEQEQIAKQNAANLGVRSGGAAYIMYTSGSSGEPKGVVVPHRAILRLVRNANYFTCSEHDVFFQFAPIAFDASTFEIWAPLLNGAHLAISPPGKLSLDELGRAIERCGVTTLWLTAGLFNQMLDGHLKYLRGVRQLLAGGEALSVPHVLTALRELPDCRLINGYGPTENTTFTCCHSIPTGWPGGRSVPIGRPISNTGVVVLNSLGEPVPPGIPGELYTRGDGLAYGYLNREELTAEKFVELPSLAHGSDSRWYRTGDRVRWRTDGTLEFLGRMDDQVKLRGYRIEPGEIEHVLRTHSDVREAVVNVCGATSEEKVLAAYVVWKDGLKGSTSGLRQFLEAKLPAYMVPACIMAVEQLPLTRNGKIDRRALPAPNTVQIETEAPHTDPRNDMEASVLRIWVEVLGRNGFGVHDNFFHLGGHSLLATHVISRIAGALAVELPMSVIFECPTVAKLCEAVVRQRPAAGLARISQSRRRASELLAHLDELTEEQVEVLLRDHEFEREVE